MKREVKEENKNIYLDFHTEYNFLTLKHYYLMSILRNLVMNSIEAMGQEQEDGNIKIIHRLIKDEHNFLISDNGSGMEKENLDYIFSPGFSTKINYSTGEINRGLGLSIVKQIVEEQFKGKINVESTLGKGMQFHIIIPRKMLEEIGNEDLYS